MSQTLGNEQSPQALGTHDKLPNFLVIGAAKAGTTSLYEYLKQHPQIYMSPVKETNFFIAEDVALEKLPELKQMLQDLDIETGAKYDINVYRNLFRDASEEIALGEVSPNYLYSTNAIKGIKKHIPEAKFIAVLRQPVERAYSEYLYRFIRNIDTSPDFETALQGPHSAHYLCTFAEEVKQYIDTFGRDRIRIYLYEDLKYDSLKMMQDIYNFLGVDSTFAPNTKKHHNVSYQPRSKELHALLTQQSLPKRALKKVLPVRLQRFLYRRILAPLNKSVNAKPPAKLSPEDRARLLPLYREGILTLQALIGRDLSSWLK